MAKEAVRILVTDAGGRVAYDTAIKIGLGEMLGFDQRVILHLFCHANAVDEAAAKDLADLLRHAPLPLLKDAIATTDIGEAFNGVEIAILIGQIPNKTSTSDSLVNRYRNYKLLAEGLENYAAANCKVLVIAYPAHTLASTVKKFAPSIPVKNITCLTRSYHNFALGLISNRLNIPVSYVKNVVIWGNHLPPVHLDVNHATVDVIDATVDRPAGEYSVRELINDDAWLNGEFITTFQEKATYSIEICKYFGANLLARAACLHIHDWVLGTPEGHWYSMGLFSDGSYNVPEGLMYSFPATCRNGEWTIVQGLPLDEFSRKKMDSAVEELMKEHEFTLASIKQHLHG